jgi:hypothetical protein
MEIDFLLLRIGTGAADGCSNGPVELRQPELRRGAAISSTLHRGERGRRELLQHVVQRQLR